MEWLNLRTSVLHAPEYIGSPPLARATWVNVSLWSAHQENGGRIVGARLWGSRQWQQTCGVTKREIQSAPLLLTWDANDLIVWSYPIEKESVVRKRREIGRTGGVQSGVARGSKSEPSSEANTEPIASTERNGIGKEEERKAPRARCGLPDSLNTPQFSERWLCWQTHWSDTFNHGNPMPEMTAFQHLRSLSEIGEQRAIVAINNSIAKGHLRVPAEPYERPNTAPTDSAQPIRLGQNLTEGAA